MWGLSLVVKCSAQRPTPDPWARVGSAVPAPVSLVCQTLNSVHTISCTNPLVEAEGEKMGAKHRRFGVYPSINSAMERCSSRQLRQSRRTLAKATAPLSGGLHNATQACITVWDGCHHHPHVSAAKQGMAESLSPVCGKDRGSQEPPKLSTPTKIPP